MDNNAEDINKLLNNARETTSIGSDAKYPEYAIAVILNEILKEMKLQTETLKKIYQKAGGKLERK